ncbi:MAG: response regulator transcription factor [Leptolyngbya sp.]|nr:response regulator transcription factor [Candidatus Melainabacteria bacterium]
MPQNPELNANRIRIILVDDQSLIRDGLKMLLSNEVDLEIIGEAANGLEACRLVDSCCPDVILMDLRMPLMDGIKATKAILEKYPQVRVLILTTFDDEEYLLGSLRAGASGYLLKDTPIIQLAAAIRSVHHGNSLLSTDVMSKLLGSVKQISVSVSHFNKLLTEREMQVFSLVGQGKTNLEIALDLNLTEGTVKNYITKILAQIGARDRIHAVLLAQDLPEN